MKQSKTDDHDDVPIRSYLFDGISITKFIAVIITVHQVMESAVCTIYPWNKRFSYVNLVIKSQRG